MNVNQANTMKLNNEIKFLKKKLYIKKIKMKDGLS